ncbi:tRNA (guanine(37)-N1)-methyltransferase Trm5b [Methanocaldococcus infernus]
MTKCIKVEKKRGEEVRKILVSNDLLNKEYKIDRDEKYLYIPIKEVNEALLNSLIKDVEVVERELEKVKKKKSFRDVIEERYRELVDKKLLALGYDIIGDLVILQISDKVPYNIRKEIGELAYKLIPCKGVFRKKSEVKGEYRVRELEHLAGENRTLTIHRENNYRLYVDIAKVYFSPRLSGERKRIGELVNINDVVIDMFAGVGPFSIACKMAKKIYSIDINPYAIELLKKNIELNKVYKIEPILDDVRNVNLEGSRVIMNLPKYSYKFVDKALELVKRGGVIHYYTIGKDFNEAIKLFESKCNCSLLFKRVVKSYSPKEYVLALDFLIEE